MRATARLGPARSVRDRPALVGAAPAPSLPRSGVGTCLRPLCGLEGVHLPDSSSVPLGPAGSEVWESNLPKAAGSAIIGLNRSESREELQRHPDRGFLAREEPA